MEKRCVLVMGGAIRYRQAFAEALEGAELVLAADSGARHFEGLRRLPDAIMGDLDSLGFRKPGGGRKRAAALRG